MSTHPTLRLLTAGLAVVFLASACGGSPTSSSAGGQVGKQGAEDATKTYTKLMELPRDELIERAQEEGQLTIYTSMTSDLASAVAEAFDEKYGIDVNLYRAGSETVLQKVLQEQRAGFAGNDIVGTNATEMIALSKKGYFTPYNRDPKQRVSPQGRFSDWTATRFNVFAPSWNTKLVESGEQPTSWESLADPRWRGKLAMEPGDYDWYLTLYKWFIKNGKSPKEAQRIFRGMARNAKIVKGHTVQGELLSAGQYAVSAANYTYLIQQLVDKGAPVAYRPVVEPAISRPNGAGLMKTAEHPAAAVLFMDWILTEGQDLLAKQGQVPSTEPEKLLQGVELIPVDMQALATESQKWVHRYDRLLRGVQKGN